MRRPSDRLFQGSMKPSDCLRRALQAAAGEHTGGTQCDERELAGRLGHGGDAGDRDGSDLSAGRPLPICNRKIALASPESRVE